MCALVSQSLLGRCQIHVECDLDSQPSQRCILKNILKNLTLPTFFFTLKIIMTVDVLLKMKVTAHTCNSFL